MMQKQRYQVKRVTSEQEAQRVVDFLLSQDAFTDQEWTPGEVNIVTSGPFDSVKNAHHAYWYIEHNGEVIGAMGLRENDYKSGGYEASNDYFAVHRNYRQQGVGSLLLQTAEEYAEKNNGRFILIETCDTAMYRPAQILYEKHGYKRVAHVPDYYLPGEGRVDYYKKLG